MFTDTNANFTPQVRIGAQVGRDSDANSISREGAGAFVVYTGDGTDESGAGSLSESFRVSYNGDATAQGIITATGGNSTEWNTAFGWGDHSVEGYLTSYTETDPIFSASPAGGITATNISNWNTAYGWGDHDGLYDPAGTGAAAAAVVNTRIDEEILPAIGEKLDSSVNPIKAATVSNDTITFTRADNTTFAITTSDANTNYYLDDITKSGNTLTYVMNGKTDVTYTFGSNAFTSYTNHVGLYDTVGTAASEAGAVNTRIDEEVLPLIQTPAITSNGSTPSLNSGISAAEVRTLIGAGTSSTDTNYYLNGASFNTTNGVLTLTVSGAADQTVDLDGRYLTSYSETDTLDSVTDRGSSTTNSIEVGGAIINGYLDLRDGDSVNITNNVIIDELPVPALTDGYRNVSMGWQNFALLTSGARNITFGIFGLPSLTSGNDNIGIGMQAGRLLTTGDYNISIGYASGETLTTGSGNIYIGERAKASSGTVTNEIAIGKNSVGAGSNSITLGGSAITKTILRGDISIGETTLSSGTATGDPTPVVIETFSAAQNIGAFIDFTIYDDGKGNMRSGTLQLVFNTDQVMFNEVNTMDIGDTTPCTLDAVNNAGTIDVRFTSPDPTFHIKYHVRTL
jgi:hypothetical protein